MREGLSPLPCHEKMDAVDAAEEPAGEEVGIVEPLEGEGMEGDGGRGDR